MSTVRAPEPAQQRRGRDWFRKLITFWTLIAIVSGVALLTFADVGEDVAEQSTVQFDNAVRAWFVGHQNPVLAEIALILTWIGSPAVMVLLAIGAGVWFYRRSGRSKAGVMVAAPAVGGLFSGVIKVLYAPARPAGGVLLNTYSFPSGHAATSAAVAVTLFYVLARERIVSWPTAIVLGGGVPLIVGLTRLYLDVHWTTDVVAGWAVGLFVAAMSAALYETLRRSAPPDTEEAAEHLTG